MARPASSLASLLLAPLTFSCLLLAPALTLAAFAGDVYVPPEAEETTSGDTTGTSTSQSVAQEPLFCASSDPYLVGYALKNNFQVVRYSTSGSPTSELNLSFPEDVQVTALAMGGDSLIAVGTDQGRIEVHDHGTGTWKMAFSIDYPLDTKTAIRSLAFGGIDYLGHGTEFGDFEIHKRPVKWDHEEVWSTEFSREYTNPVSIEACAMNDAGWLLHGTELGYVALWAPEGDTWVEANHWQIEDEFAWVSAVALEGNEYVAFGTDMGQFWRYERQADDSYLETLNREFNSLAAITAMALAPDGSLAVGNSDGWADLFEEPNAEAAAFEMNVSDGSGPLFVFCFIDGGRGLWCRSEKFFSHWAETNGVWDDVDFPTKTAEAEADEDWEDYEGWEDF